MSSCYNLLQFKRIRNVVRSVYSVSSSAETGVTAGMAETETANGAEGSRGEQ
jgi:hypothetical protein